jgi:phosphatidylglycerophosphatase A
MPSLSPAALQLIQMQRSGSYSTARDALKHRLWDSRTFAATITNATFFVQPIGAAWITGAKTKNETNMVDSGKLPAGQVFLIARMSIGCLAQTAAAGVNPNLVEQAFNLVLANSVFEIKIQGRDYDYQIHGSEFLPRPIAVAGTLAAAYGAGRCLTTGWSKLDPTPIVVDELVGFQVTQEIMQNNATSLAALNAGTAILNTAVSVMQVTLEGLLTRAK